MQVDNAMRFAAVAAVAAAAAAAAAAVALPEAFGMQTDLQVARSLMLLKLLSFVKGKALL